MSEQSVIKLRLALMGRPVRNYTFDKPVISVGRDPEADVFVDNPGVSRDHFRLERTTAGEYQVVDMGSANGTFLNDQMINNGVVRNNDVVRFGKYTMWVGYEHDRRSQSEEMRRSNTSTEQHTIVLSRNELGSLMEVAREKETHPEPPPAVMTPVAPAPRKVREKPAPVVAVVISFLLGAALGAGALWLILQR